MKPIASGKVREIYAVDDKSLLIVTTDRISAFDVIMPTPVVGKGKVLNALSEFWFDYTKHIVPNHMITTRSVEFPVPFTNDPAFEGRSMLVRRLKMLPIECIVRGYITGSGWESYQKTGKVCGIALPEGLQESQKLPEPIFTPSTKADEGHDENIDFDRMCEIIGTELAEKVRAATIAVYKACADYAASRGILIADTKLEFGLDENGVLTLGDEVLTPDSSRFWPAADYAVGRGQKSFDKQYLRDWLKENKQNGVEPAPELPADVVAATIAKYREAARLLGVRVD
ncbi:MAG: phosphoribosylaminoimidazolesuccinocarboxamide synthase [Clostridiaceae bacterium]|nr:phosphoribosylaminoimidazolesuccinocarboxamide synthase [Clostridiaceae bacterium]